MQRDSVRKRRNGEVFNTEKFSTRRNIQHKEIFNTKALRHKEVNLNTEKRI